MLHLNFLQKGYFFVNTRVGAAMTNKRNWKKKRFNKYFFVVVIVASDFLRWLCVRAVTWRTEEALSRQFVREPDICLLVHNHTGWFQGEQLFLYNLEVIHRLKKKQKSVSINLAGVCGASREPCQENALSHAVFGARLYLSHCPLQSLFSSLRLSCFLCLSGHLLSTCYKHLKKGNHRIPAALSRTQWVNSRKRSRPLRLCGPACSINSTEGAAEVCFCRSPLLLVPELPLTRCSSVAAIKHYLWVNSKLQQWIV